jgi:excinuclease ABC subunit B
MRAKAEELDFEGAAMLRDRVQAIKDLDLGIRPKNAQALKAEARAAAGIAPRAPYQGKRRGRGNGRPARR